MARICFFFFLILTELHAQDYGGYGIAEFPDFKQAHFSSSDGLAHRQIIDLIRGPSGRLWVSTRHGISYFDGNEFTEIFTPEKPDSLSFPLFWVRFTTDNSGNIWGIPGYGKGRNPPFLLEDYNGYIPEKIIPGSRYQLSGSGQVKNHCYLCFFKAVEGLQTIHLLARELDLDIQTAYDSDSWELINQIVQIGRVWDYKFIDQISEMEDGSFVIWLLGRGFLWIHSNFSELTVIENPADYDQPNFWEGTMPIDHKNRFWFPQSVVAGELKFNFFELPGDLLGEEYRFDVDRDHNIWIFGNNKPIFKYDFRNSGIELLKTDLDGINCIYYEKGGLLWLGSENGLFRLNFRGNWFQKIGSLPFSLSQPAPIGLSIRSIVEGKDGQVYTNQNYGSVFKVDNQNNQLVELVSQQPDGKNIEVLEMDYFQNEFGEYLILGTSYGLLLYDLSTDHLFSPEGMISSPRLVTAIFQTEDRDYHHIFNADNEHFYFHHKNLSLEKVGEIPMEINQPLALRDEKLYGSTGNGLGKFVPETGEFREVFQLKRPREIDGMDIRALHFTDSVLWLGTHEGFYGLDKPSFRILHHFNRKSGLPGDIIYNMVHDGKGFWLGTDNGLTYIEPEVPFVKSFFEWDGLSHREFNTRAALLDSQGKVWMGGLNGINLFDPEKVKALDFAAEKLFLNSIEIYDTKGEQLQLLSVQRDSDIEKLRFSPTQNALQFNLSHFNLNRTGGSTYSWYLEDLEYPWSNRSQDGFIAYRNMAPGDYLLRIKATDYRGVPSTNELEVTFTILQFWYLRTWAILLWVFLIIGGVYWVVRYLFRRKLERQRMSQLEELDRQKTRLYTNITHEFRTPLTVILGLTEKAKEMANLLTNDSRKMFRTISHNGSQLLLLVNQMMDLAGVEYGKIQLDKKPVQIAPFIKHLCFSFESMASQKRIELYYEFSGSDKAIHLIDPQRLQQLISNLLTNAIKFSPAQSSIFIHASLKENQSGHTFSFKVRDNGPGIPSGEEEKVFDRFHRVDSDQTRHLPGSGIGLALAKELVELMNGSIRVENSSGGGAVFSFEIPLKNEVTETSVVKKENSYIDAEDLNIALASLKPHTGSHRVEKRKSFIRSTGEKPLILLVEDHPDVLSYIESCIPDQYQTATAVNGKEGVKLALEKIPDLIISDVMMPELDGYQLCDQLKQHRATSHIPILLLTAKSDDESRLAGLKHGADAYLAKPFNKEELLIRIGNMFKLIDRLKQMYSGSFEHPKKLESESSPEGQFLQQFYQTLEENYTLNTFGIEQMSDKMNLSRSQLYRKIKAITDDSPSAILKKLRLQKGRRLLFENPDMTIAEVAYSTGFSSGKYFSDAHLQQFGVRPKRVEARHIIKQDENE